MNRNEILFKNLFKRAGEGDPKDQNWLGAIYDYGFHGFKKNDEKAFEWYMKAAIQGDAEAQHKVGWMYYEGRGVEKDYEKALEWLGKAVNQENAEAQYQLGNLYYSEAEKLFEKASKQGIPEAYTRLGVMYLHGLGVEKDPKKAQELFEKASEQLEFKFPGFFHEERYDV